jgi:hypothetical protein
VKYFILASLFSVTLLPAKIVIPLSIVILIFYFFVEPFVTNYFKRNSTYILFIVLVVIQPLLIGESTQSFLGIEYSAIGFENGITMFLRASVIITSITIINRKTKTDSLHRILKRIGFVQFEDVLKKAEEVLPQTRAALAKSINVIRESSSIKKNLHNPSEIIARILVQLLHKTN